MDKALTLAGYDPRKLDGFFRKQQRGAKHVKRRLDELRKAGIGPGLLEVQPLEEPTRDAVLKALWEMANSDSPPPAAQVSALNHLAGHFSKLAEAGGEGRPDPLHLRVRAGAFKHELEPGGSPETCWFCGTAPEYQDAGALPSTDPQEHQTRRNGKLESGDEGGGEAADSNSPK